MPRKLKTNESTAKYFTRILEKPRMAMPSSSGKGEARMNPPTKKVIQRKKRRAKSRWKRRQTLSCISISDTCSEKRSRTNRKMIRSPTTLPSAPKSAVTSMPCMSDISPRAAIAGAVVKMDVKKTPAIKAPNISNCPVEARRFASTFVRTRSIATNMLSATSAISCRI